MIRFVNSGIVVRCLNLIIIVILLVGVSNIFLESPAQATNPNEQSDLLQFTSAGHVVSFQMGGFYASAGDHMLGVEFVGASDVVPVTEQIPIPGKQIMPLGRVTYTDLWKGVNLSYESTVGGIMQSSYLLAPGADVGQIQLRYNAPVEIEVEGSLRIDYKTGEMRESPPVAWQEVNGERIPVEVSFYFVEASLSKSTVGYSLGSYNPAYPLIIDPTIQWNTFMGSSGEDWSNSIALDGSGNVYVVGTSNAAWGSAVNPYAGDFDAFAAKLNNNGVRQWITFMGSPAADYGYGIAVDGKRGVYVSGSSFYTWGSPVNPHEGYSGAFACKLSDSSCVSNSMPLLLFED